MAESYQEIESRIERAIIAIKREEKPIISRFARIYNIPYQRLLNRLKGRESRTTRNPAGRLLSDTGICSLSLYQYIR
jgi:hypothetical protein